MNTKPNLPTKAAVFLFLVFLNSLWLTRIVLAQAPAANQNIFLPLVVNRGQGRDLQSPTPTATTQPNQPTPTPTAQPTPAPGSAAPMWNSARKTCSRSPMVA